MGQLRSSPVVYNLTFLQGTHPILVWTITPRWLEQELLTSQQRTHPTLVWTITLRWFRTRAVYIPTGLAQSNLSSHPPTFTGTSEAVIYWDTVQHLNLDQTPASKIHWYHLYTLVRWYCDLLRPCSMSLPPQPKPDILRGRRERYPFGHRGYGLVPATTARLL